ncbi:MAG: hypothetical protein JWL88_65 [Parcubacteria group bacterium]|nr:hypothetical protein [Parcubacteria group bacterium]
MIATMFERLKPGDFYIVPGEEDTALPVWRKNVDQKTGTKHDGLLLGHTLKFRPQAAKTPFKPTQSVLQLRLA